MIFASKRAMPMDSQEDNVNASDSVNSKQKQLFSCNRRKWRENFNRFVDIVRRILGNYSRVLNRLTWAPLRNLPRKARMDECVNILEEFYIPSYIIVPESEIKQVPSTPPSCPVIVFINSKSGGQLGCDLLTTYRSILNKDQVFDLGEIAPDKVLRQLYANLEKLRQDEDSFASDIENRLRIIVAGGDGTASWILGVVINLKLPRPPPVATVPLGTGNNLPFSFGWGKKNPDTDSESVQAFLEQVQGAREMNVDSWDICIKITAPKVGDRKPMKPLRLPSSLHRIHHESQNDCAEDEKNQTFQGGFWNYFSMGMDAQVSYAFHTERKLHPEKFKSQKGNQSAYLKHGCKQGWFLASLHHSASGNIGQLARVKVMSKDGQWEDLDIPKRIRSIVCLNLPSFSGGFNPWGTPTRRRCIRKGWTPVYVDDGMLEVVGFKDAWHGLVVLAPYGHGTRLAQTNRIQFEFHKRGADHTYMRTDGEPWKQPLPLKDDAVVIEISHLGQVKMLATPLCRSRSVHDAVSSRGLNTSEESAEGEESTEGEESAEGEENIEDEQTEERDDRSIGSVDASSIPDEIEIDISHLS